MAYKLRGSRLEAEIDKYRGECDWNRLEEYLSAIQSKKSGVEKLVNLIEGELCLETFLEKHTDRLQPRIQNKDFLRKAESELRDAITNNPNETTIVMEAYLLLSKLYYFCSSYNEALSSIEKSMLDKATTQFTSLRSLKLAAEGYAIKGLSIEQTLPKDRRDNDVLNKRVINCFEKSAELTLSYVSELEKVVNSSANTNPQAYEQSQKATGFLLEASLERIPYILLRRNFTDKRWDADGIEWYRRITTIFSDKIVVSKLQKRLCRQLAEILLRAMVDIGYDSKAINLKSESLNFYTGSNKNFFSPQCRHEEIILLLSISELLTSRSIKFEKNNMDKLIKIRELNFLRQIHNLLTITLSYIRQYNSLITILDRAMTNVSKDRFLWFQFGLSLACSGRYMRSVKFIEQCTIMENHDKNDIVEHMMIAKINIEFLGNYDIAMEHASIALKLCQGNWQSGRCALLYALAFSLKILKVSSFETRKVLMNESLKNFEKAIEYDPYDELSHLLAAQEYAECRNLDKALEYCQRSLEINDEQPSAIMLLALLFTSRKDYKSALTLVINALLDYPNHYGLLVLRMKLEAKYKRLDEVLNISKDLLLFWKRIPITYNHVITEEEDMAIKGISNDRQTDITLNKEKSFQMNSKEALAPVTPIFTAPLGLSTTSKVSLNNSNIDITDSNSIMASTAANLSELGAGTSTISGSFGIMSSSSVIGSITTAFKIQANIWVELADFFLDAERISDVQTCVEEACNIFPNSHEAMYLKGRLFVAKSKTLGNNKQLVHRYYSEAKSCYLSSLSIMPNYLPSMHALASLYHLEGNLVLAEKMLRDIIIVDPLHYQQWHKLGCILGEQNRFEEAQDCFITACNLESSTPIIPFKVIPRLLKTTYF